MTITPQAFIGMFGSQLVLCLGWIRGRVLSLKEIKDYFWKKQRHLKCTSLRYYGLLNCFVTRLERKCLYWLQFFVFFSVVVVFTLFYSPRPFFPPSLFHYWLFIIITNTQDYEEGSLGLQFEGLIDLTRCLRHMVAHGIGACVGVKPDNPWC